MIRYKCILVSAMVILVGINGPFAQQNFTSGGGDVTANSGSVSFSVGQLFYYSLAGSEGSVQEGVQQPYEISEITGIKDYPGITLEFKAYPNPVTDYLTLSAVNKAGNKFYYCLYDSGGRILQREMIAADETNISMLNCRPGLYILQVSNNTIALKTFKIIKK